MQSFGEETGFTKRLGYKFRGGFFTLKYMLNEGGTKSEGYLIGAGTHPDSAYSSRASGMDYSYTISTTLTHCTRSLYVSRGSSDYW